MRTAAPGCNCSASSRAALCALVTMSSGLAVKPIAHRCWATSAGPREALLVTNNIRERTTARVSTAPGVGSWTRKTVPSRSRSRQSWSCARVLTLGELRDPLFCVGDALAIGCGGLDEPLQCVLVAAEREQRFGVGVAQPGCRRSGAGRIELRCRQKGQRLLVLPEVGAGAGHDDAQLVGVVAGELRGLGGAGQFDGAFRAAN